LPPRKADCRPLATASELDVRDQRKHLLDPIGTGSLDLAPIEGDDAGSGFAERAPHPLARHDDRRRAARRRRCLPGWRRSKGGSDWQ